MVRMQDVAERANVSIATVSFVVNNTKPVAAATRSRVEAAMTELGFTRNVLARALASRRSRIIALQFPEMEQRMNAGALQFVHGAAAAAAARDHHLVLWPVGNDPVALREYLEGGLVDGVLAMEVQLEDPRVPLLEAVGMPFVLIGRTADTSGYAFADIDFEAGTTDALARLRALGHSSVALVLERHGALGASAYGPLARVEETYRDAAAAAGARRLVVHCERSAEGGLAAAAELLEADPAFTAVVVMNDEAAPGLVKGLRRGGARVPEDVSVIGLSMSTASASFADPALDHLAPPGAALGRAAAHALIDRLEDPEAAPIRTLLPCTPMAGASVAPARVRRLPRTAPDPRRSGRIEAPSIGSTS